MAPSRIYDVYGPSRPPWYAGAPGGNDPRPIARVALTPQEAQVYESEGCELVLARGPADSDGQDRARGFLDFLRARRE